MKEKYIQPLVDVVQFQSASPIANDGSDHDNGYIEWGLRPYEDDEESEAEQQSLF